MSQGVSGAFAPAVTALAIDPDTPATLYAGIDERARLQERRSAETWKPFNAGLFGGVIALAIDPLMPNRLYAGTDGGVFSIQEVTACVGDCDASSRVTVDELVKLVTIALDDPRAAACVQGAEWRRGRHWVARSSGEQRAARLCSAQLSPQRAPVMTPDTAIFADQRPACRRRVADDDPIEGVSCPTLLECRADYRWKDQVAHAQTDLCLQRAHNGVRTHREASGLA